MLMLVKPISRIVLLSAFLGALFCSNAYAKDLEMLARLLIPAYIAQNFTVLCVKQDERFLAGMKVVSDFTEHVKHEITVDLPEEDAAQIRVMAADAARDVARRQMEAIRGEHFNVPPDALKKWCDESAKPFVLRTVRQHHEKHGEFDMLAAAAKR